MRAKGRPPGQPKTGGRRKGVPNKASVEREKKIAESGITPLDYMLQVLRSGESNADDKKWAATSAAPYVHPKLATIEHMGKDGGPVEFADVSDLQRAKALAVFMARTRAMELK